MIVQKLILPVRVSIETINLLFYLRVTLAGLEFYTLQNPGRSTVEVLRVEVLRVHFSSYRFINLVCAV